MFVFYLTWIALGLGTAAAAAALYGHYRVLPGLAHRARGVPDGRWRVRRALSQSALAPARRAQRAARRRRSTPLLAIGLLAGWPAWLLFVMMLPAVAMSIVLGYSLLSRGPAVPHLLDRPRRQRAARASSLLHARVAVRLARTRRAPLQAGPIPTRSTNSGRTSPARSRPRRSGRIGWRRIRRTSSRRGSWPARATGSARTRRRRRGRATSRTGIAAGRAAIALAPNKPEGHFWVAANMGALAESFGMRQGLKYRGDIKDELETVLRLDPAFQQGSADRALGRWYYKVPGLFGGSNKKSEEHLRKSLTYNPEQRRVALLPRRDADRRKEEGRSARDAGEADRGAAGSRLGPRGSRLQGEGAGAAGDAAVADCAPRRQPRTTRTSRTRRCREWRVRSRGRVNTCSRAALRAARRGVRTGNTSGWSLRAVRVSGSRATSACRPKAGATRTRVRCGRVVLSVSSVLSCLLSTRETPASCAAPALARRVADRVAGLVHPEARGDLAGGCLVSLTRGQRHGFTGGGDGIRVTARPLHTRRRACRATACPGATSIGPRAR